MYALFNRLNPKEKKDWEKKLTTYAYEVNIACQVLLGVDKTVKKKLTGKPLGIVDSVIRAVYAGLQKVYQMLADAKKQVDQGNAPDFTGDIPFPPPLPPIPSDPNQNVSWFTIAWGTVKDMLNLLAEKSPKLAEFLPPIEAAGDELVKDLKKYFPSTKGDVFPAYPTDLQ